jgi:hypothetical protein
MDTSVGHENSAWKLFWEDREPILLGLAFGGVVSAFFPLAKAAFSAGWVWLSSPGHSDSKQSLNSLQKERR